MVFLQTPASNPPSIVSFGRLRQMKSSLERDIVRNGDVWATWLTVRIYKDLMEFS